MKRILATLFAFAILFSASTVFAGQPFPDVSLIGKLSSDQKAYLGVSGDTVKVSDIKGDYLFIEAYSMYCPICQRDAAEVNEVYEKITAIDPQVRVKFIGLALGNTAYEVKFYQKKYSVPFPLFVDEDYAVHKALGEVGTPSFYIVKLGPKPETLYMKEGELKDKEALLKMIKATAGLK